ncbi:MAG TPA: hypothetical protein VD993_16705 [Chitinophagaceae bacterium]|nr:hypothetical protein [Chitinophagaceae bacterium]
MKIIFSTAIALFITMQCAAQQLSDSSFDVSVTNPAFKDRHPRILFDEGHENFHTTTGRYKPFVQLAINDGCQVTPNKEKFNNIDMFNGYDLLVIANAFNRFDTIAFTIEECQNVRAWIMNGGSLLLITDHMPMSKLSQQLAETLGVSFTIGTLMDSVYFEPAIGENSHLLFTKENKLLPSNEFTKDVNRVVSFTGQGVKGPRGSITILQTAPTAYYELVELADFKKSEKGFTVKLRRFGYASAEGFSQAVAFRLGKGRVIVTGEAAMLTAQVSDGQKAGMNFPGVDNKQLVLNMLRWLLKQ